MRKVVVIGLGSMGKRRIRIIRKLDPAIEVIGVDLLEERCNESQRLFGIRTFGKLENVWDKSVQCAFICTSPLSHAELITKCLKKGVHVFSELNLIDKSYEENIQLAKKKQLVLFLSSTFLYRKEVQYIQKAVNASKSELTYSYHVGQYLPDWHPWEDYREYFVSKHSSNACRELMGIEFPWLCMIFGKVLKFHVIKGKKSTLDISYPDSYCILLEHENGVQGNFLVDIISRKPVRNLEIFGEDFYLVWDGSANGLKEYDIEQKKEKYIKLYDSVDVQKESPSFIVENAYYDEVETFFSLVRGRGEALYCFEDDKEVLRLIDGIESE